VRFEQDNAIVKVNAGRSKFQTVQTHAY